MTTHSTRQNTPTEQNKEDQSLILYRIEQVEKRVAEVSLKMDKLDVIKRSDLLEFKDAIFERFAEKTTELQTQINEVKSEKAEKSQVDDLRGLVKGAGAFFTTVLAALVVFYLTNKH